MTIKWIKISAADDEGAVRGVKRGAKKSTGRNVGGDIDVRYDVHRRKTGSKKALRGRVIVLPGLTEFIEKHQDQINGFAGLGFETICIDWPGQGLSTRLADGHPHIIHIPDFALHLKAITAVMHAAGVMDDSNTPLFIFGHSMGGHLALRLARILQDNGDSKSRLNLRGVMLSAPMIMIPVVLRGITLGLFNGLCRMGMATKPVPGHHRLSQKSGAFNPRNVLTRDPDGYALQHNLFKENPKLQSGGLTFGWVRAALQSCRDTTTNPAWMAGMKMPVQAHLAGDEMVTHRRESAPNLAHIEGAEMYIYDGARHELMLEVRCVRTAIWDRMAQFIDDHITA